MLGGTKFGMNPGFTIIEITIVLAIISALVIIAFLGQGELRSRARFNDAVNRTVSMLANAQNESNSTLNASMDPARGTLGEFVFFGTLVEFEDGESDVQITPMWRDNRCTGSSCPIERKTDLGSVFTIPWNVYWDAKPPVTQPIQPIVFARRLADGRSIAYTPWLRPSWPSTNLEIDSKYSLLTDPNDKKAKIELTDGQDNHVACITVEAGTGHISSEFVPCT